MAALELIGENKLLIIAPSRGYRRLNDNTPNNSWDLESLVFEALARVGVKAKVEKSEAKDDLTVEI